MLHWVWHCNKRTRLANYVCWIAPPTSLILLKRITPPTCERWWLQSLLLRIGSIILPVIIQLPTRIPAFLSFWPPWRLPTHVWCGGWQIYLCTIMKSVTFQAVQIMRLARYITCIQKNLCASSEFLCYRTVLMHIRHILLFWSCVIIRMSTITGLTIVMTWRTSLDWWPHSCPFFTTWTG